MSEPNAVFAVFTATPEQALDYWRGVGAVRFGAG